MIVLGKASSARAPIDGLSTPPKICFLVLLPWEFLMYQKSAFKSAFWAGLASPVALFSAPRVYIPAISGLTIASAFVSVGASLNRFAVMTTDDQEPRRCTAADDEAQGSET